MFLAKYVLMPFFAFLFRKYSTIDLEIRRIFRIFVANLQNRKMYRIFAFILLLLTAAQSKAQEVSAHDSTAVSRLAAFVRNVNAFNAAYPQERVYLHFDNTGYFIGENMWFKAYVVAGPFRKLTDMSGVLYVELLTPEGRIAQSCKLKIENGQACGRFQLGHLLHAGYYEVRAYTRMMLNWDEAGVFSRVFPIFDKAKTTNDYLNPKMTLGQRSQKIPEERQKSDLKVKKMNMLFFPEGGNIISSLKQKVAFKVFSEDGRGQQVDGFITDTKGNKISQFRTLKNGIGTCTIVEYEDEPYKASFNLNGKDYEFDLPKAHPNGYAIGITSTEEKTKIHLQRNVSEEENVGLAISNGGSVYFFHKPEFSGEQFALSIDREALRDGVNQITLFNDEGKVMCQRMVFKRPSAPLHFTASFDKESYKPFDKVTLSFELTDSAHKPVPATFSLAVRDADTNLPGSHTGNALNNLLLSSELKGFIEDIDYYFEADDEEHNLALDNLMLTQGWYRYNWEQMENPQLFKTDHYIEEGLIISGKLSSVMRHKNRGGSKISVILYDKEKGLTKKGRATTDSIGHFAFQSEDFYGRWQMYIRTTGSNQSEMQRKEMNVHLDRQFSPESRAYEPLDTWMYLQENEKNKEEATNENTPDRRKLDKYKYENLIPETVITAEKRWMEGKAIKEANIVYDLEEERTREDDTGELYLETLFDYLERTNRYFTFDINEEGNHDCYYKNREIQWIIDNQDYSLTDIETINAKDIEAILINDKFGSAWKHSPFTGLDSINGTSSADAQNDAPVEGSSAEEMPDYAKLSDSINRKVLVYLYIDKNAKKDRIGERNTVVQGFTKYVGFYSPDYEALVLPDEKDFRRTLYWNPNITTDQNGKAKATFYNNGQCTLMEIDAQTITADGSAASINN